MQNLNINLIYFNYYDDDFSLEILGTDMQLCALIGVNINTYYNCNELSPPEGTLGYRALSISILYFTFKIRIGKKFYC